MKPEKKNAIDYKAMGERIRQERKNKGMTIRDLAIETEIPESNLGGFERGARQIGLPSLVALTEALDVNVDYLLFGSEQRKKYQRGKET